MRCLVRSAVALSAVTAAVVLASPFAFAQAQTISYSATIPQTQVTFNQNFTLQQFDTNLGTLIGIRIDLSTDINATVSVFNPTSTTKSFTQISGSIPITITGPSNLNLTATATAQRTFAPAQTIAPSEQQNYNGLTSSATASTTVDPSGFAAYQGNGNSTVQLSAGAGNASASGTGDPNLFYGATGSAGATIRITYTYVVQPEPSDIGLLSTGLGAVGFVAVRRRRRQK